MHSIEIMLKKIISIFSVLTLCIGIFAGSILNSYADEKSELNALPSKYMVLMDYSSGKVLYQKDANIKIYPASTTKIWTAFCVLKKCKNLNEQIEIKNMPSVEGSSMYLENGEKFTVLQLLEGLLIHSSNDVAYVLAVHFGNGKVSNFINFMNEEAAKYGATNTHFANPHGLPDEKHYTTAMDMTNLARVAYGNKVIKKIVAMKEVSFKKSASVKVDRQLFNSNKFLSSLQTIEYKGKDVPIKYDIVDGIKTGYTDDAGNCLVSTAQKNGIRLIAGVYKAPGGSLYHDSRMLLDYGFDNFKNITVLKKENFSGDKEINFAKPGKIHYTLASDYVVTVPKNQNISKNDFKTKYDFNNLKLPIKKGDIIGTLNVFENGNMVSSIGLVAETNSESWTSYIIDHIPFLNKKELKDNKRSNDKDGKNVSTNKANGKKQKTDANKKSDSKSTAKKNNDTIPADNNQKTSEKANSDLTSNLSLVDKAKNTVTNSFNGFIGMCSGAIDNVKSLATPEGIKVVQKTDFYKFLDKEISSHQKIVPSKYIIFGVPLLILVIILFLIIGIIKDSIKKKRAKKKEMKVSDIRTKDDEKNSEDDK